MNDHTRPTPAAVTPDHCYMVWTQERRLGWFPSGHAHASLSDAANDLIEAIDAGKWSFPIGFQVQLISNGTVYDMTAAAVCAVVGWNDARDGSAWLDDKEDHPIAEWLRKSGMSWADAANRGRALIDAEESPLGQLEVI